MSYDKAIVGEHHEDLLAELWAGQQKAARRSNASSLAVAISAGGSGSLVQSLISGMAALGGRHAPIQNAMRVLAGTYRYDLTTGQKIPGWGSSFVKGGPDPIWTDIDAMLSQTKERERITAVTEKLHAAGKMVWPNAAIYTAAVASLCGIDPAASPYLVIAPRIPVWVDIFLGHA